MTTTLTERSATASLVCPAWCRLHDVNNCGEVYHQSDLYAAVPDDVFGEEIVVDVCQNDFADDTTTGPIVAVMWSRDGGTPVDEHKAFAPQCARELAEAIRVAAQTGEPIRPIIVPTRREPVPGIPLADEWIAVEWTPQRRNLNGRHVGPYVEIVYPSESPDQVRPHVAQLLPEDADKLAAGLLRACGDAAA